MAYDEDLAERVRAVLPAGAAVTERQMFGGLAFMLGGHMFCGVVKDTLMVRLGPDGAAEHVAAEHEGQAAEHLPFGHRRCGREHRPDPLGQVFVIGHRCLR